MYKVDNKNIKNTNWRSGPLCEGASLRQKGERLVFLNRNRDSLTVEQEIERELLWVDVYGYSRSEIDSFWRDIKAREGNRGWIL